jgi:hypothetical protein
MLNFITGSLVGILVSIVWACILYHSKIQRDWGFWFSDIIGIVSAIIIGFYMPRKLSQALNHKKDKKQYLLNSIEDIEEYIDLFTEQIESYCCPQKEIDKSIAVSLSLHKMAILGNKMKRIKETNKKTSILGKDAFESIYQDFLDFRGILDDSRNTDFIFDYNYLKLFVTETEIKLLSKLHEIKLILLNKI